MIRSGRGKSGDVAARLARAEQLAAGDPVTSGPLNLLGAVLRHHQLRAGDDLIRSEAGLLAAAIDANRAGGRYPLLDLDAAAGPVMAELDLAVESLLGAVLEPLAAAGHMLAEWSARERRELVETWLDDTSMVGPLLGFWIRVAASPLLETAVGDRRGDRGGPRWLASVAGVRPLRHLVVLSPGGVRRLWRRGPQEPGHLLRGGPALGAGGCVRDVPRVRQDIRPP
jgi:hypothetical protein